MDVTKCHYRSKSGRLVFEIQGGSTKEIFEGIASVQETFEADEKCGCCGSDNIAFRVREVQQGAKVFKFFELHCLAFSCHARFSFGQSTDMKTLFPKRKDENNNWLPNRGWSKYVPPAATA